MLRLAILISGRGSNLQAILAAIDRGELDAEPVVVISSAPNAAGLGFADRRGVPTRVIEPASHPSRSDYCDALGEALKGYRPDLIALAGFMVILEGRLLHEYRGRIVNIHPSLLPAFPGAHAHLDVLRYGAKVTGCTVHFVDEGVDSGPIIAQEAVEVLADDDQETLAERVLMAEHRIYPKALQWIAEGRVTIGGRIVRVADPDLPARVPRKECSNDG